MKTGAGGRVGEPIAAYMCTSSSLCYSLHIFGHGDELETCQGPVRRRARRFSGGGVWGREGGGVFYQPIPRPLANVARPFPKELG